MKRILFFTILFFIGFATHANAQAIDTLPNFSVHFLNKNKVQISWINPYPDCNQLVVQRSYDSIKFFTSIFSAQSPELQQNGFVDNQFTPGVKVFYRIFYVLKDGHYFFTASKSPANGIATNANASPATNNNDDNTHNNTKTKDAVIMYRIFNRDRDSLLYMLEPQDFKHFKDSVYANSKDTLTMLANYEVLLKRYVPKIVWKPSIYVFTNNKGYVTIALPDVKKHEYHLKFFNDKNELMFQMNNIQEKYLVVDKSNFLQAGWYFFELYEDHHLKEKNKFYLEKEF
ncbi:hypothetical protein [Hydrotalea sp.]|uniref:hypothetical protein n=1 Tax=Hydrotalea sp. TaxID=2881279 RepID=UPI003D0E3EDE